MLERELFNIDNFDESLLQILLQKGYLFVTISEAKRILGLTDDQVRYAIENYRLDALLIAGRYRIPISAFSYFDELKSYGMRFSRMIQSLEISGVFDLCYNGKIAHVVASLHEHNLPLLSIDNLIDTRASGPYESLSADENDKLDWYNLDLLSWPSKGLLGDYAEILRVQTPMIKAESGLDENTDWPSVYDYLIDRELVNISIPYDVKSPEAPKDESNIVQLELF